MTLNVTRSKVHHICTSSTLVSQISLHFTLRSLVFQIIEAFGFSIRYNGEYEFLEENLLKS